MTDNRLGDVTKQTNIYIYIFPQKAPYFLFYTVTYVVAPNNRYIEYLISASSVPSLIVNCTDS